VPLTNYDATSYKPNATLSVGHDIGNPALINKLTIFIAHNYKYAIV